MCVEGEGVLLLKGQFFVYRCALLWCGVDLRSPLLSFANYDLLVNAQWMDPGARSAVVGSAGVHCNGVQLYSLFHGGHAHRGHRRRCCAHMQ